MEKVFLIATILQCVTTGIVISGVLGTGALLFSCCYKKRMQHHAEMVEHLLQDPLITKVQVGDFVVERTSADKPLIEIPSSRTPELTDSSYQTPGTDIPSPMEPFPLIDCNLVDLYFSFTNSSLFMQLTLTLVVLLLFISFFLSISQVSTFLFERKNRK